MIWSVPKRFWLLLCVFIFATNFKLATASNLQQPLSKSVYTFPRRQVVTEQSVGLFIWGLAIDFPAYARNRLGTGL